MSLRNFAASIEELNKTLSELADLAAPLVVKIKCGTATLAEVDQLRCYQIHALNVKIMQLDRAIRAIYDIFDPIAQRFEVGEERVSELETRVLALESLIEGRNIN